MQLKVCGLMDRYGQKWTTMNCWKCGSTADTSNKQVPFRATCEKCYAWLHVCVACKHYMPGRRNDCEIPETDYISDRESINYCEYFEPTGKTPQTSSNSSKASKFFGEDIDSELEARKKKLKDLLNDF